MNIPWKPLYLNIIERFPYDFTYAYLSNKINTSINQPDLYHQLLNISMIN